MGKILIVDDHPLIRKGVIQLLSDVKIQDTVFEAEDGSSAIEIVLAEQPDLIIMDIGLKNEDGIILSKKILKLFPETNIIILTIHSTINFIQRALDAGVKGYILKDSIYQELLIAINKVRRGKTYLCENSFEIYKYYNNYSSDDSLPNLSSHEKEILQQLVEGGTLKSIGTRFGLSEKTISVHKINIMKKLGVKNFSELIILASKKNTT
jgi:two-component system, NarL family, response regulator NreC